MKAGHACDLWLTRILGLERIAAGFHTTPAGDTTVRTLGAQRWVIEDLETSGFIKISFPYSQSAVLTLTAEGHRFLNRSIS